MSDRCCISLGSLLYEAPWQQTSFAFADEEPEVSQTPLDDALEEDGYLQPATFEQLARTQTERTGPANFSWRRVVFTPSKIVYVTSTPRGKRVHELKDGEVGSGTDALEFLANVTMYGNADEYFTVDLEQQFNDEFWSSPMPLYHGTGDIDAVMRTGIEPRSETRGLNNRSVGDAVFTTSNAEIAGSYGDVVMIDMAAMAKDGLKPFVSQEPEILEHEQMEAIASRLGIDDYMHEISDSGIDYDTVIVYGTIPARYLKLHR